MVEIIVGSLFLILWAYTHNRIEKKLEEIHKDLEKRHEAPLEYVTGSHEFID